MIKLVKRVYFKCVMYLLSIFGEQEYLLSTNKSRVDIFCFLIIAMILFTIISVFHIWSRYKLIDQNLQISENKRQLEETEQENKRLRLEAAFLRAPNRIYVIANGELEMRQPSRLQIIHVSPRATHDGQFSTQDKMLENTNGAPEMHNNNWIKIEFPAMSPVYKMASVETTIDTATGCQLCHHEVEDVFGNKKIMSWFWRHFPWLLEP